VSSINGSGEVHVKVLITLKKNPKKTRKYHTTVSKVNKEIVKTRNTHLLGRSLAFFGASTSMKMAC
jgi:hypothetical protein